MLRRLVVVGLAVLAALSCAEAPRRSLSDVSSGPVVVRDASSSTSSTTRTTVLEESTTTTTLPGEAPTTRGTVPEPSPALRSLLSSTAYCLTGTMANGQPARRGAVAANRWPLGTRLRVNPSPVGELVTVEDRIGSGSELDFALPGSCDEARQWGRRRVSVEVVE